MTGVEATVQNHYTSGSLLARIDAALAEAGIDMSSLTPQDLFRLDQLHGGGIAATQEHAERAGVRSDMHVLDLGCGIGGSSRYLATLGCRVTGIDLTQEFIDAAAVLTRRCGLGVRVTFRQANALELPFADESFDHVWCHNVTMNIPDKPRLAAGVARVLKRGGRLSCVEIAQGPAGPPTFPLPWARTVDASALATPARMREAIEAGGLRIITQDDTTASAIAYAAEASERTKRGEPPLSNSAPVMGDDFMDRARNSARGLREGTLVDQFILAEKI